MTDLRKLIDPKDLPPMNKRTVNLGQEEIVLDADRLLFNDASLSQFQDRLAIWYDYFSEKLSVAEYLLARHDSEYDVVYSKVYADYKEDGATDKLSEAHAKANPEVQDARKEASLAKQRVQQLKQHLKAWDKAHDNAQSRGYMLRKEMDKLHTDIMHKDHYLAEKTREYLKGSEHES
jgi:hypothetical protein